MSEYREHEKLAEISDKSQAIGEFLDWLTGEGVMLCEVGLHDRYWPIQTTIPNLLAEYFGIDQEKLEREKRLMLDHMRRRNAKETTSVDQGRDLRSAEEGS